MSVPRALPGEAAARGYRIGSRSRGRSGFKFYIAFNWKRVSPYFVTRQHAVAWFLSKVTT